MADGHFESAKLTVRTLREDIRPLFAVAAAQGSDWLSIPGRHRHRSTQQEETVAEKERCRREQDRKLSQRTMHMHTRMGYLD